MAFLSVASYSNSNILCFHRSEQQRSKAEEPDRSSRDHDRHSLCLQADSQRAAGGAVRGAVQSNISECTLSCLFIFAEHPQYLFLSLLMLQLSAPDQAESAETSDVATDPTSGLNLEEVIKLIGVFEPSFSFLLLQIIKLLTTMKRKPR